MNLNERQRRLVCLGNVLIVVVILMGVGSEKCKLVEVGRKNVLIYVLREAKKFLKGATV